MRPVRIRCSKCEPCRAMRAWDWQLRSTGEFTQSKSAWFGTLTFHPVVRRKIFEAASSLENGSASRRLFVASGRYVTLFLKRLRKAHVAVRYLLVSEPHRDGFPHWHACLFEPPTGIKRLGYEVLNSEWTYGHSSFHAMWDPYCVRYVTKYIHKVPGARVRASIQYGLPPNG